MVSYLLSDFTFKKGISSIELSKTIGVTQKTAWYLLHKIRYMLEHRYSDNQLRGTVEVDETYVGGKKKGKRGRGYTVLYLHYKWNVRYLKKENSV